MRIHKYTFIRFLLASLCLFWSYPIFANTEYIDQLKIQSTQYEVSPVSTDSKQNQLSAIVTILNNSPATASNFVIEAKFLSADGKLLDVITQSDYGVSIPAGKDATLKVKDYSGTSKASVNKVDVRIISAEFASSQAKHNSKEKNPWWIDLLVNWGPMLFFVLAFIYLCRGQFPKNYYARVLDAMEKQTKLQEKQLEILEKFIQRDQSNK